MHLPFVDVIIPHLNDRERLAICLDLLERQTYPRDRYRVLVVDNGSDIPIDDVVARFPLASAASEAERGCGSARNRGAALTTGDILAFTDSDCRPEPDWIANGVRHLRSGRGVDIVGGEIRVFCADEAHPTDAELLDKTFGFEQRRYVCRKHFSAGANIMVSREVFATVGPFRNGAFPEDLEWGRRAWAKGFRIGFAPDVLVRHPARRTWNELKGKADRTAWHSWNYLGEKAWPRMRWALYTCGMALPPLWKCAHLLTTPVLAKGDHRRRAIATLFRVRYYRAGVMLGYLLNRAGPARAKIRPLP
ncbi:MAG: glycosyltransferase [Magnetospirillum sp.]|nr:glycosyltransferase [Magnetospirillum sp.]